MAQRNTSPGVFTSEIDKTFLPGQTAPVGAAIIGPTVKGPAGIPTVVSTYSEYQRIFGDTFISGSDTSTYLTSHTAREYLRNGGPLTVIRIMKGSFGHATATISASIDPAVVGGGTFATGSFTLATGSITPSGSNQVSMSISNTTSTITFKITGSGDLATQAVSGSPANIITTTDKTVMVLSASGDTPRSFAVKFADLIGSQSLHGLTVSASAHTGSGNASGSFSIFLTSSKAGRIHGNDGTPFINGSNITQSLVAAFSTASVFKASTDIEGGEDFNDGVSTEVFKLHTLSNGEVMNSIGPVSSGSLVSGSKNNLRFSLSGLDKQKGEFNLVIRQGDDTPKRETILETFNGLSLDPSQPNYIAKIIGDRFSTIGDSGTLNPYVKVSGSYANNSKYVRVEVLKTTPSYLDENGDVRANEQSSSLPSIASGSNSGSANGAFSGGADGTVVHPINFYENITDTNSQGFNLTNTTEYEDAIHLLGNKDEYDINLLFMPGVTNGGSGGSSLIQKAIDMCNDRGDCMLVADPTLYGAVPSTAIDKARGKNTSFAAMYYPWLKVADPDLGVLRWVPPSVLVAGAYKFNDKVAHPWNAVAGLNRGILSTAIQTERELTHSLRDDLYASNVNPIVGFPGQGITIFGQKTLQKKKSALDRINVRRLLINIKKFVSTTSRFLLFEQNNAKTRNKFLNTVNPFLQKIQSNGGLTDFRVVMDETNNTPDLVDRNRMIGQLFIKPTRTAEFIVLDFNIEPTGASFSE